MGFYQNRQSWYGCNRFELHCLCFCILIECCLEELSYVGFYDLGSFVLVYCLWIFYAASEYLCFSGQGYLYFVEYSVLEKAYLCFNPSMVKTLDAHFS